METAFSQRELANHFTFEVLRTQWVTHQCLISLKKLTGFITFY